MCLLFSAAEGAGHPSEAEPSSDAGIAIEVPQVPSTAEAGPSSQPSDRALSDTSQLDKMEKEEDLEKESEEEQEEDDGDGEEEEKDEESEDERDDDEKDRRAKQPAKDEPDHPTGLLPEYMIAESVPDLPSVDG